MPSTKKPTTKSRKVTKVRSAGGKPKPRITGLEEVPSTPRTAPLPGLEDAAVEEIREAALAYVDVRDRRVSLTARETEKQNTLLDVMKSHGLRHYHDAEAALLVEVMVTKEKVRVTTGEKATKVGKPEVEGEVVHAEVTDEATSGDETGEEPEATS